MAFSRRREIEGGVAGVIIGTLGGLVGLGGAEFRLPVLVGRFNIPTLEAVIFNKATSLAVVIAALAFRLKTISPSQLMAHWDVAANLLAGSLIGAWVAAGCAMTMPRHWLDRIVLVLLSGLSAVMLLEAWGGLHGDASAPLFKSLPLLIASGVVAGFSIGIVAALLGVAGGELLIPAIVLLYGLDVKLAGSLSLLVSFPTMLVGFARYSSASAFSVLKKERSLFAWLLAGSVIGAACGALLLDLVPTRLLLALLGCVLLISAIKTFKHSRS